jgi:hypothetical protein
MKQTALCINYSEENLNNGLQIFPEGLLSEKGLRETVAINETQWHGEFCFFCQLTGDIPFDIFAASFYLLTLYEEYIPKRLDSHGRFHHEESLVYRNDVLEIPLIDRWACLLKDEWEKRGYDVSSFQLRKYRVISTFDIDHPYLYRNKGLVKNAGGALRDLLQGKWKQTLHRIAVLFHIKQDPYFQAICRIDRLQKQFGRTYYLFILIAGRSRYDRKTIYPQRKFYHYLKQLQSVNIGLHPSYGTLCDSSRLMKEKQKLERILNRKITLSRQHFLRMQIPVTFRDLNLAGIEEDFTLSFASVPGFRSGTAVPHFFYDIECEEETGLLIRPTVMMDSTLIIHQGLSPDEALQKMKSLADACKKSGGDYLTLWHNSNLSETEYGENTWIDVFIKSYKYALSLEQE